MSAINANAPARHWATDRSPPRFGSIMRPSQKDVFVEVRENVRLGSGMSDSASEDAAASKPQQPSKPGFAASGAGGAELTPEEEARLTQLHRLFGAWLEVSQELRHERLRWERVQALERAQQWMKPSDAVVDETILGVTFYRWTTFVAGLKRARERAVRMRNRRRTQARRWRTTKIQKVVHE